MIRAFFLCSFLSLIFAVSLHAQIAIQKVADVPRPVDIAYSPDGTGRIFIASQRGKVFVYTGRKLSKVPFLDLSSSVACCDERGLLSIAFHPQFKTNGFFFAYYTDLKGNLALARFKASGKNSVDLKSKLVILSIPHPTYTGHNGGKIAFGKNGYLYLSTGDGGGEGDPNNNAQSLSSLLGKILRIDVNRGTRYSIPSTNPFVKVTGARKEIWAIGLRNPWKISFDRKTGDLYISDVGHNKWEEVSFQPASAPGGQNYGWRKMEGKHCFKPATGCNDGKLKLPFFEYTHNTTAAVHGCSITGGYVYRGSQIPTLRGTYVYADLCKGVISGIKRVDGVWRHKQYVPTKKFITTFGEDQAGELYFGHLSETSADGIYRIVAK